MKIFKLISILFLSSISVVHAEKVEKPAKLEGILRTGLVAFGSETTGIAVETSRGRTELVLPKEFQKNISDFDSKVVRILGKRVELKGPELGSRKAIEVSQITFYPALSKFEGKLISVVALGSETTGHALELADGTRVELVLSKLQKKKSEKFMDADIEISIAGISTTLYGPETGKRKALLVQDLEAVQP